MEHEQLYHAVYLENLSCHEFTQKLCTLLQISIDRVHDVYLQGPSGIHILVTDEVGGWPSVHACGDIFHDILRPFHFTDILHSHLIKMLQGSAV